MVNGEDDGWGRWRILRLRWMCIFFRGMFYEVKVGIRRVKIEMLNVWLFCAATFLIVKLDY